MEGLYLLELHGMGVIGEAFVEPSVTPIALSLHGTRAPCIPPCIIVPHVQPSIVPCR